MLMEATDTGLIVDCCVAFAVVTAVVALILMSAPPDDGDGDVESAVMFAVVGPDAAAVANSS